MRKLLAPLVLVMLIWFPAVAYAAADDTDAIASLVRMIARGILDGDYLVASAVTLSLLTTLARLSWQLGGLGGAVMLGVHAFAGSLAATLVAGQPASWAVVETALRLGAVAAGGYSLLQPIARWLRPHVERRVPQPLRAVLLTLLRLVDAAPPAPSSTRAPTAPIAVALVIALLATAGCSTVRRAGAAGVDVGLDCTSEELRATIDEAGALARAYVLSTISGTGQVDAGELRATARALKTEALRCSFLAAIAAIAAGAESGQGEGPRPLLGLPRPVPPDPQLLRDLAADVAVTEWGIQGAVLLESERL